MFPSKHTNKHPMSGLNVAAVRKSLPGQNSTNLYYFPVIIKAGEFQWCTKQRALSSDQNARVSFDSRFADDIRKHVVNAVVK